MNTITAKSLKGFFQNKLNLPFAKGFFVSVAILLLGFVSGLGTMNEITNWYSLLNKPFFNPPNFIFGPVWTILYILMGISVSIILTKEPGIFRKRAIVVFIMQFTLNLAWSSLFFNFHLIGAAFIEIVLMLLAIIFMIVSFYRLNRTAGLLQIPYLIWVCFASILNYHIYILN